MISFNYRTDKNHTEKKPSGQHGKITKKCDVNRKLNKTKENQSKLLGLQTETNQQKKSM